jgi:hypothetical protein
MRYFGAKIAVIIDQLHDRPVFVCVNKCLRENIPQKQLERFLQIVFDTYAMLSTAICLTAGLCLARISHQAAWNTDKALARWRKVRMIKHTVCYSRMPITVQASLRVRKLALYSKRSYCYAFRSRAALTDSNPAPAPVIPVRNAGYSNVLERMSGRPVF